MGTEVSLPLSSHPLLFVFLPSPLLTPLSSSSPVLPSLLYIGVRNGGNGMCPPPSKNGQKHFSGNY